MSVHGIARWLILSAWVTKHILIIKIMRFVRNGYFVLFLVIEFSGRSLNWGSAREGKSVRFSSSWIQARVSTGYRKGTGYTRYLK